MINLKEIESIKWEEQNIAILGAGISGLGALKLAKHLNANILLSDSSKKDVKIRESNKLKYEYSGHTDKILKSDLIIKSPGIPNQVDIIKRSKNMNIPIVSEVEFASWFSNSDIIAITGSNGKTTTVNLIFEIFKNSGKDVLLGGNVGTTYSENVLYELQNKKEYIHILEISSYQAEYLYHFNPEVSCILNISEDHMDRYRNMNEYINAKLNIVKNLSPKTKLIYNYDDEILSEKIKPSENIIPFSIIDYNKKTLKTSLVGIHNSYNILAAVKIAELYRVSQQNIEKAIRSFKPLPHRVEFISLNNGVKYINDSKSTTLASTIAATKCFKNIILILGGELKGKLNLDEVYNCINDKNIKTVILYGKLSELLKNKINLNINIEFCYEFNNAIKRAISTSCHGDVVLLSPGFSSFDQFKNYKERGDAFKKIIQELDYD